MEIVLVRHGKSLWMENKPIMCQEFKNWVEKYDEHGVVEEKAYPEETLQKARAAKMVFTSDLKRAVASAKLLTPNTALVSHSLFRETELPIPSLELGGLKLRANIWAVVLRCLWFGGYSKGCESLGDAGKRAEKAAARLVEYAKEYHTVVLVGHGFFNRLIGKELLKMGWTSKGRTSSKHWASTPYSWNQ